MARIPDSYVARISGTFEIADGTSIDVDDEITLECKVIIQEVGLRGMRDGSLRMAFVCKPTGVRVVGEDDDAQPSVYTPPEVIVVPDGAGLPPQPEPEPEPEPERRERRPGSGLPDGPPVGTRISSVQSHGNVAGSPQSDRDPVLMRFLEETGE